MSEQELKSIASQLRCPQGEAGITMGERMNSSNGNMIQSAIDALQWNTNDVVVEIGPGNGFHIPHVLQQAKKIQYIGIDISETMIQEATQRNKTFIEEGKVSFKLVSSETIPLQNNFADNVFTVNTIYFWPHPKEYLNEIHRVLKPGGQLAISFATETFMKNLPFTQYGFELYDEPKVLSLLKQSGYIVQTSTRLTEQVQMDKDLFVEREFYIVVAIK